MVLGSSSRDSAAETCFLALDKAIKTHRLYEGRGELSQNTVIGFLEQATQYLDKKPALTFQVSGQGFKHGDRVLSAEDRSGQGYFQMFKDGLREITFIPGFTEEEAHKVVQVLSQRNKKKEATASTEEAQEFEEDTVTRIWDSNFTHIRYDAIDSFVEGDVFVPELNKKVSLAQWVNTKMEAFDADNMDEWSRVGPPLKAATPPPGIPARAMLSLEPSTQLPEAGIIAFRGQFEEDTAKQMERFAVIWGEMLEKADEKDSKILLQMMIGLIKDWMDEGNWSGLLRTLSVLQKLAEKPNFKSMVQIIVQESASPTALQRLKPHLEEIHPRHAREALRFHRMLGRSGLETLCKMLANVPPGPVIQSFEKAFRDEKINPLGLYLARVRSREIHPVVQSIRKLAAAAKHPMVLKALRGAVTRDEREIRNAALGVLRNDPDPATQTGLGRAVFDLDPKVRSSAIRALTRIPSPIGQKALLERIRDSDFRGLESEERVLVLRGLVAAPGDEIWAVFEDLLAKNRVFGGKNIRKIQAEIRAVLVELDSEQARKTLGALEGKEA